VGVFSGQSENPGYKVPSCFMKTFLSFVQKKLLVPILISLFSIVGAYVVQQIVLAREKPVLKKDVIRTDLAGLSPEIRQQITLLPINYSLQNNSHAPAKNVTIFIKSDSLVSIPDLKFSQESEDHQLSFPDVHEFKVNVPTIRPGGLVSFQIITTASNNIAFSELADNAQIVTPTTIEAQKEKSTLVELGIIALAIFVWFPVLTILIYVFWKTGKSWQEIETGTNHPEFRKRLIILIVALYIYNDLILGSFGPIGMWLPLPRINFLELIYAFIFYLLVTRYKLIENWISAMIERQRKEK
jgi:hypothetical protein